MTDPDLPAVFYNQDGQTVDVQYNAETIHFVSHIGQGSNGKRCPVCNASPMKRAQLLWEENTRRHRDGMMILANLAVRVAPPKRPGSRPVRKPPPRPPHREVPTGSLLRTAPAAPRQSSPLEPLRLASALTERSTKVLPMVGGVAVFWVFLLVCCGSFFPDRRPGEGPTIWDRVVLISVIAGLGVLLLAAVSAAAVYALIRVGKRRQRAQEIKEEGRLRYERELEERRKEDERRRAEARRNDELQKYERKLKAYELKYAEEMRRYEAEVARSGRLYQQWKRTWFCQSCSARVVEED
ncbi:hypothetical protein [Micromonospora sp. NPDC003776]